MFYKHASEETKDREEQFFTRMETPVFEQEDQEEADFQAEIAPWKVVPGVWRSHHTHDVHSQSAGGTFELCLLRRSHRPYRVPATKKKHLFTIDLT